MTLPHEPPTTDERLADAELVDRAARRAAIRWHAFEERIVAYRRRGMSLDHIAQAEDCARSVVALILRKRGIP